MPAQRTAHPQGHHPHHGVRVLIYDFKLPDIGEGIGEAQLISWMVALGDEIEEGAEIASVSTDKVDFELPSPCAGTIVELLWTPGDTVPVGEVLIRIERSGSPEPVSAGAPASPRAGADGGALASARVVGNPSLMGPIVAA
ncbi:MAG: hypothetical protein O7A68_03250, partial [Alphaproteobacteria bacterium]|nr:hypothetical protein [Alphaproteobacteria bacterium]